MCRERNSDIYGAILRSLREGPTAIVSVVTLNYCVTVRDLSQSSQRVRV